MVSIKVDACVVCGGCIDICPKAAIRMIDDTVSINPETCSECLICVQVCPVGAPYVVEQTARDAGRTV